MDTIDLLLTTLHDDSIWIHNEGSAEGFLGVDITGDASLHWITLMQAILTHHVVEAFGLCQWSSRGRVCIWVNT